MTDRIPHSDELVSAYLDGETAPAETALVEHDAALMARAAEMRTLCDAVSAPVAALSAADRERMIGTAMAEADEVPEPSGVVVPLRRFSRPMLAMAAAVALLAAVAGAGLLAGRHGSGGETDMALESPALTAAAEMGIVADTEESAGLDSAAGMDEEASVEYDDEMSEPIMGKADDAAAEAMAEEEAAAETADAADAATEGAMAAVEPRTDSMTEPAVTTPAPLDATTTADSGVETSQPAQPDGGTLPDESDDEAPELPVARLGPLDGIDSLVELVAARSQEPGGLDDPRAEGGACSRSVRDRADAIGAETVAAFVAMLDETAPVSVDALLIRHADALSILYAIEPDCAPGLMSLDETSGE